MASREFMPRKIHTTVVGAGAFGGWTALHLLRRGAQVTMLDAWGPGNSRASSGGETRVMRAMYGPDQPYSELAARSMKLWRQNQRRWKRQYFFPIGVLWMAALGEDAWERRSLEMLNQAQVPYEEFSVRKLRQRWPQINFEGVKWGVFEPESGFLMAREGCIGVGEAFVAEGGTYRQAAVLPQELDSGRWPELSLSDGSKLRADRYVFACGPWMGQLFPSSIGNRIQPTKQDVFFFGAPAGDARFDDQHLPVWADHRGTFMYGIPGNRGRGFKIADDTRGPAFDPTTGERTLSAERLQIAREYMGFRFPGLKDAPLIESRVCQYEQSPDDHFIVDHHPHAENVWLVGGGSGHGYKHGPALGEFVARLVLDGVETKPCWALKRFSVMGASQGANF
jgi:glycine/D-amino acid oxidase-like deaminating enzyme